MDFKPNCRMQFYNTNDKGEEIEPLTVLVNIPLISELIKLAQTKTVDFEKVKETLKLLAIYKENGEKLDIDYDLLLGFEILL